MWEALYNLPRGRVSARNIIRFVTATLVATFVYLVASTTPVQALNTTAVWESDDTISYSHDNKKDYTYKYYQDVYSGLIPVVGDDARIFNATTTPHDDKSILEDCTYRFIYFNSGVNYYAAPKASYVDFYSATCDAAAAIDAGPQTERTIDISPRDPVFEDTLTEEESSCQIDGVGWIVCSMSGWIAKGMDYLYDVLGQFFEVAPLTTARGGLHEMWTVARNLANAAFVIVALIMIYSIMTGGLMSNYGIKRLLPRLLLGSLLVNTSYWICAVAIDISNILGVEIQNLLISIRDASGAANIIADVPLWQDITALVLGGGTLTLGTIGALSASGGAAAGLVWLLLGAMIPAIFAALVAVMILAARQALIVILVALAPLAFVLYLLPNTEEWFHRWRKSFTVLLVMFPAFSVLFGGSQLAGLIIIQNSNGNLVVAILGLAVQVVPLFITPFLIKLSSGIMGTIAGMVNDRQKGLFDRAKNFTDEKRKFNQQRGLASRRRDGQIKRGWQGTTGAAQALDRRRRRRERLTGAYEKGAQANFDAFSHGRAGREVVMEEKAVEVRSEAAAASNELLWQRRLAGHSSAGGRTRGQQRSRALEYNQLHHAHEHAHIDKGLAKVIEENHHSYAERALQQRIHNAAGPYRNLQVQTDVAQQDAEFLKSNVQAEGKAVFKRQFADGDIGSAALGMTARDLRQMNVNTTTLEKEAEVRDSSLKHRAEAHWNHQIHVGGTMQRELHLQNVVDEDRSKLQQENASTLVENIRAKGDQAPYVTAAETNVANAIHKLHLDNSLQSKATDSAKLVQQSFVAEELKLDDEYGSGALLRRAAGVDDNGAARVLAGAKRTVSKELLDNIENIKSTMPYPRSSDSSRLQREFEQSGIDMAERIAMILSAAKNGSGGYETSLEMIDWYQKHGGTNGQPPSAEEMADFKELIGTDSSMKTKGRDVEMFLNDGADTTRSITEYTKDITQWNIAASRFVAMSEGRQKAAIKFLKSTPEGKAKLSSWWPDIKEAPTLYADLKDGPKKMLEELEADGEISGGKTEGQ